MSGTALRPPLPAPPPSGRPEATAPPRVGLDVVDVARLAERLERSPGLAERLFTPAERAHAAGARRPAEAFAAAFAAKEALVKALGRGLAPSGPDDALQEAEWLPGRSPALTVGGGLARRLRRAGGGEPAVSASVAGGYALATVVLAGARGPGRRS